MNSPGAGEVHRAMRTKSTSRSVHRDLDCRALANVPAERIKTNPPAVYPDWVPRCPYCAADDAGDAE